MNQANKDYAQEVYKRLAELPKKETFIMTDEIKHSWSLTGIRHIIAINELMGTPMSDKEWADMSIR